ncbi:MAG TPA: pyridoxamine 5'-phosphate oxidase family protein, partial [Steroidobacteraceae bacterium]|nr:pyridoxamine 5'-phosphate oxidase family protein [Steroidobacteraceae bacterium]
FILARDSFYMATVSETGWPYVQHRGGPAGFLKVLDSKTLGFADYRGNRQYVSTGNLSNNDRIAMILVDYPNRQRLKIMGHVTIVHPEETELLKKLESPGYAARVERGFRIAVAAFDWNCPQHITPRFTEAEVESVVGPLQQRLVQLEKELEDCAEPRSS